ncbi:unnamed protein product [Heterobilharzia americana]|nr:unnamed protein product [Heterobilharzia americana]
MSKNKNRLYPSMCSLPLCMKPHNQFMSELQKLSRHNRQNSVLQPPNIFGHLIDLQKLYNEVVIRGGHKQVTISHLWMEVYLALGLPPGCVDAGHGLRTLYQRYLELFERNQRMMTRSGFTSDEPDSAVNYYESDIQDLDQTMKVSKTNTCGASVRLHTEEIPSHLRGSWNLSTDLKDDFEYTSLERSLLSGLPNEVELALNTVLLMSSQLNSFSINKNPRLLDVLLCSVGITCSSNGLMSHSPDQISSKDITCHQRKYLNFWNRMLTRRMDAPSFLLPSFFKFS